MTKPPQADEATTRNGEADAKRRPRGGSWNLPAARVTVLCIACIGFSAVVSLLLAVIFSDAQVFAAYGIMKKILLPSIYFATIIALLWPYAGTCRVRRPPAWWWWMAVSLCVGLVWSLFTGGPPSLISFVQDVLLMGGFLLLFHTASQASTWPPQWAMLFVSTVAVGGLIGFGMDYQVGPFTAITPPAVIGLIYAGILGPKLRTLCVVTGVLGTGALGWQLMRGPEPSMAILGQTAVCVGILLVCLLPLHLRKPLVVVGLLGALVLLYSDGTLDLMHGSSRGVEDVTLAQRGCEARVVFETVTGPSLEPLLGLAPGGTVDLSACPDAATLKSAGRDLRQVDDVHLLTSWVVMKSGAVGWVWLGLLMLAFLRNLWQTVSRVRPSALDVVLLMCVAAGLMSALPAATNFFSNPLMPIALGVLWARTYVSECVDSIGSQ